MSWKDNPAKLHHEPVTIPVALLEQNPADLICLGRENIGKIADIHNDASHRQIDVMPLPENRETALIVDLTLA